MKWIRAIVMTLVIAPALLAGPLAANVFCSSCETITVGDDYHSGAGFFPFAPDGEDQRAQAFQLATDAAMDRVSNISCDQKCAERGLVGTDWDQPEGLTVVYAQAHGPIDESALYVASVGVEGTCCCENEVNLDSKAPRVEATPTQKVISLYKQVKESVFKRLFGRR